MSFFVQKLILIIGGEKMIGISVASKREWQAVLKYFHMKIENCHTYPYGEYFFHDMLGHEVVYYRCGVRKVNASAANQYMISTFNLEKVIVIGTCAGIGENTKIFDIYVPSKAVQYDCTIKEMEPMIKKNFIVEIDLDSYGISFEKVTIGTADRAVVLKKDEEELAANGIRIADCEAAAIAYVCAKNQVECIIIKGVSDKPGQVSQEDDFRKNVDEIMEEIIDMYLEEFVLEVGEC